MYSLAVNNPSKDGTSRLTVRVRVRVRAEAGHEKNDQSITV